LGEAPESFDEECAGDSGSAPAAAATDSVALMFMVEVTAT
jgi:hypothetical protein